MKLPYDGRQYPIYILYASKSKIKQQKKPPKLTTTTKPNKLNKQTNKQTKNLSEVTQTKNDKLDIHSEVET